MTDDADDPTAQVAADQQQQSAAAQNASLHNKPRGRSILASLNVSHNQLYSVPACLPCCAPALTRLNLANNRLTSMGAVCAYPPRLKHLDLANNIICELVCAYLHCA